jgi:WD40 repeat protein
MVRVQVIWVGLPLVVAMLLVHGGNRAEAQVERSVATSGTDLYGDPLPKGSIARLGTVRFREGSYFGATKGLAFLPDGRTLVTAGEDTPVQFWEASTGKRVREVPVEPMTARAFALSRDGRQVAVAGFWYPADRSGPKGQVRVLEVATGTTIQTLERDARDVDHASIAFTPDGKYLASLGNNGALRIEEIATSTELLRQAFPRDNSGSLAISPDGQIIAVATGANTRKHFRWKWQAGEEPSELKTVGSRTGEGEMAFSPDGRWLAWVGSSDTPIHIWDAATGELVSRLHLPAGDEYLCNSMAFSPDGKSLFAPTGSGSRRHFAVHQWSTQTWQHERRLDIPAARIAISPDARLLATGRQVFDLASGKELSPIEDAHRTHIDAIAVTSRGQIATGDHDGIIRVWDAATSRQTLRLDHDGWVSSLAASPDGTRLASAAFDDTVRLWELPSGKEIYRLPGHGRVGGRRHVAFHPDGQRFLSFGDDMYLRAWDVRTGKALVEHKLRPSGVRIPDDDVERNEQLFFIDRCGFSPDGQRLVIVLQQKIFVFDVWSGKEQRMIEPDGSGRIHAITFSPDGRRLVAGGSGKGLEVKLPDGRTMYTTENECPVGIWDLESGKLVKSIMVAGQMVHEFAFAPDGSRFAICKNQPHAIKVYSAEGEEQFVIDNAPARVTALTFGTDGKTLVSGLTDTSALIWDLTKFENKQGLP